MKCNKCGFDNPEGNIFCSNCGTKFQRKSSKANFPSLPDEFSRETESQTKKYKASRRNVAVIFADISGFTAMSENLDPEEVTEKMNRVFQKLSDVIYDYQGYIDKFIGDCVMILFGAPVSHEDDPLRAVLCSIDLLKAMNELNAQSLQKAKQQDNLNFNENELNLSIGINYGKVVAGEIGSNKKMQYTVMGDTVNLASRLESAAGKGEIYVGEKVYNETKSEIEYKKLDSIKVKGMGKTVIPYKPISVKTRYMTRNIREIPMIGREKELNKLLELYKKVNSGNGQIVSIIAEAGVGKSKLFYEFQNQITANKISTRFLEGKSIDYLRNSDYFALKQILRKLIGFEERSGIEEISKKIEDYIKSLKDNSFISVIPHLKYLFSSKISDADKEKIELIKAEEKNYIFNRLICLLFKKLSENTPLIIVFDDIHWS
ncbi:AAA family ATPase, partial [candidate division WOR-3 bacterium]|nr:AAA family ATPase [candidate division WOR-3 bacterium]